MLDGDVDTSADASADTSADTTADPDDERADPTRRRRLGQLLVDEGVITEEQLGQALMEQRTQVGRRRLGQVLQDLGLVDEYDLATAVAHQLKLERIDLNDRPRPREHVLELVPRRTADRHALLPLEFDEHTGQLTVAMADPTNVLALDDLRTVEEIRSVRVTVAPLSTVEAAIRRSYEAGAAGRVMEHFTELGYDDEPIEEEEFGSGDEPVIRLVNALLADAVRSRASDVHVEPERDRVRVRTRVDGLLREVQEIPRALGPAVTSRLKIMSNLDIAERRRPQDGRAAIRVDGQEVDLRVSTMPNMHGETTVLRLLRKGAERLDLDDIGLDQQQLALFRRSMNRSQGMILMTGPTGSGKTTTLYAGLEELAAPVRNVVTLEDPVEYQLPGVNQTQMQPKIGMTFATGLRTILRQDPDVIMVGEIRDTETAKLAVEASFTGHLVLSTLHTNDAPSTVVRLIDLGVERFLLSTTLTMVVAQRLARRVCDGCAEPFEPSAEVLEQLAILPHELEDAQLRHGTGCARCDGTGFVGRIGLYEFLYVTPRIRALVTDGGSELQLSALARAEGMRSLRDDGFLKAFRGLTTIEEVARVTPEDHFRIDAAVHAATHAPGDAERAARRVGALRDVRLLAIGGMDTVTEVEEALPAGWTLTAAASAREGIDRARAERPDLLFIAQDLPDGHGLDVLRALQDDGHGHTPSILRTAGPLDGDTLVDSTVLGVTDHLEGALDSEQITARLQAAFTA